MVSRGGHRVPRAARAEQLLDVTLALIGERGYEAVSASAVARAAGITKPIIYRIYPGIDALMLALLRREQRRTEEVLERCVPADLSDGSPVEVLLGGLAGILSEVLEHPLTWRLVLFPREGTPPALRAAVAQGRRQALARARALVTWALPRLGSSVSPELDEELLARILVRWTEEQARMVLEEDGPTAEQVLSSLRGLLCALPWRGM